MKCRFLGYGDDDSLFEQRKGFKLLRESDQKIFYSTDVTFKEDEEITQLPTKLPEDYNVFYSLVEKRGQNSHKEEDSDSGSDSDSHYAAKQSENINEAELDEAISNGHIEVERGSSIDALVLLARETNVCLALVLQWV